MEAYKGVKMKISPKYYLVQLKQPVPGIDKFICVPWSWIKQRWHSKYDVSVYYPIEDPVVREKRIKRRQKPPKKCTTYRTVIRHTTDDYDEAQFILKNVFQTLDKDVDSAETKKRDEKHNTKGNETSVDKAEMSERDGKVMLKLKRIYDESQGKTSKSQSKKSTSENNQPRFHVIQLLKSKYLKTDEYVCVPQSWVRQRNETNLALIKYPIEVPSETESRVQREELFSASWKLFGGVVKYSTDSYKDAVLIKNTYNTMNEYPASTINSGNSIDDPVEALSVDNNKIEREIEINIERATQPTQITVTFKEQTCQKNDKINENRQPTHGVSHEEVNNGRPDSATYDPTSVGKWKYYVIQFLRLPNADIRPYVCIPFKWLIYEHSRQRQHWSRDRTVTVAYPIEDPATTEQRVKNDEDFSEKWDFYKAIKKYSTDDYEQAQHYIKFMIDYEHKCVNLNNPETARANATVVSTNDPNTVEDTVIEILSESDEDTTCEMQHLTLSETNKDLHENVVQCTQTAESTRFEEHLSVKQNEMPTPDDLNTREVADHKSNEGIPEQIQPNAPQYYVIQFAESPYNDIDDFICIPASWIKKRRPTDRRVMVSFPIEDPEDTENRVLNNENVSDIWISYMSIVKYAADSYEDAQWYILENTPPHFDKKGSDRKAIVKRMIKYRKMHPDCDSSYEYNSDYFESQDDANASEDSREYLQDEQLLETQEVAS
ncbi:uncharacterized protein LOC110381784 [Helicoverpa armigera]|uniref:uncharacterized protein LOC110381784 n=1 Tax=Helicoverpa armigera TaxID=29058 RepID=UPI0030833AAA